MLQLGFFSAYVSIDGRKLDEHQVQISNEGTKATCWIASEAGKQFAVNWRDNTPHRQYATSGCVKLDGEDCGRKLIRLGHHNSAKRDYFSTGPSSIRPYMFSHLSLTDDDDLFNAQVSSKLGTISIEIRRVTVKGSRKEHFQRAPPEEQLVHERMKKLATHCVGFGDEIKRTPKQTVLTDYIDKKPIFTFLFQYKPQALLEAEGIADAVPSAPIATNSTRRRASVKPEPGQQSEVINIVDSDDEKAADRPRRKKVKREGPVFAPGEVIDLT